MYTLSVLKGFKTKHISCENLNKACGLARMYWFLEPVIIDNATHKIVAVDLNLSGFAESEF